MQQTFNTQKNQIKQLDAPLNGIFFDSTDLTLSSVVLEDFVMLMLYTKSTFFILLISFLELGCKKHEMQSQILQEDIANAIPLAVRTGFQSPNDSQLLKKEELKKGWLQDKAILLRQLKKVLEKNPKLFTESKLCQKSLTFTIDPQNKNTLEKWKKIFKMIDFKKFKLVDVEGCSLGHFAKPFKNKKNIRFETIQGEYSALQGEKKIVYLRLAPIWFNRFILSSEKTVFPQYIHYPSKASPNVLERVEISKFKVGGLSEIYFTGPKHDNKVIKVFRLSTESRIKHFEMQKEIFKDLCPEGQNSEYCSRLAFPKGGSLGTYFDDYNQVYFSDMEYLEGALVEKVEQLALFETNLSPKSLKLKEMNQRIESLLSIAKQLLISANFLRKNGYQHYDIKPGNLYYQDGLLTIADWDTIINCREGKLIGATVNFMAPELAEDSSFVSTCYADFFAIGLTLHSLLINQIKEVPPENLDLGGLKRAMEGLKKKIEKRKWNISPVPGNRLKAKLMQKLDDFFLLLLVLREEKTPEMRLEALPIVGLN